MTTLVDIILAAIVLGALWMLFAEMGEVVGSHLDEIEAVKRDEWQAADAMLCARCGHGYGLFSSEAFKVKPLCIGCLQSGSHVVNRLQDHQNGAVVALDGSQGDQT